MSLRLDLVTLADQDFALPLAVLVRSIFDHLAEGARVALTVIDGGIEPDTKARLEESWRQDRLGLEISWRPPEVEGVELPVMGRIPALTYARLNAPALLPKECERAIVLDADQLVLTDLARLAAEPFGGAQVLAPRDPFIPFVSSPNGLENFAALQLAADAPYYAGALMVVDVAAWRANRTSELALAYVKKHGGSLQTHDQDAVNAVLAGGFAELDARYQVQPRVLALSPKVTPHLDDAARRRLLSDPWIVHFSGRLKPWMYHGRGPFDARFREVLSRTPFRNHRPPRNLRAALFGLYDGRLRRALYPLEIRLDARLRRSRRRTVTLGRNR